MKKFWIILFVLVLLAGIGYYFFFVPHGSARRKLAEYKKQLIAQGEKLDWMSLASRSPTNGAKGASEFLKVIGNWRNPNDFTPMMKMVAPGYAAVGHTNLDAASRTNYEANKAIALAARNVIGTINLDFAVDYSRGYETPLPHLATLKASAILFSQTAMQALRTNDFEEAALNLNAGVDLALLWEKEPLLISTLVRNACARVAINATWEGLAREGWTDQQLAALQAKWQRLDLISSMDATQAGERAFAIDAFAQARKAKSAAQLIDTWVGGSSTQTSATFGDWFGDLTKDPKAALKDAYERYPKFWLWKSNWSFDEELYYVQIATAAVDASRRIQAAGIFAPDFAVFSAQATNILKSHPGAKNHYFIFSTFFPDQTFARWMIRIADAETARRLLVTAIALKRFRLRHGAWPDTLDQMVPDFLPQVPLDFMDGKPLRYKPGTNGQYLLYSVGEDAVDNGGDASPPPPKPGETQSTSIANFLVMCDIVWPQPANALQIQAFEKLHAKPTNAPPAVEAPPPPK